MSPDRFRTSELAPPPPPARPFPWVLLSMPFVFLLGMVLFMLFRGDFSQRLAKVGAIERERAELYAVDKTPASSVELVLAALSKPWAECSASERWALEDLCQRAGLGPPPGPTDAEASDDATLQAEQRQALFEVFKQRWPKGSSRP